MGLEGKFIVFEGGEGSGKSTHAAALARHLHASLTHEPGGTEFGKLMRTIVLAKVSAEPISPRAELFCFLADRAQHCQYYIRPRLAKGETVICDRFSGSTFAYQLGGRALSEPELVQQMDAYARAGVVPDAVVYLDIDPEQGLLRKKTAGLVLNRLDAEKIDFHRKVREYFLDYAKQQDWIVIPTLDGSSEENQLRIREALTKRFK